MAMRGAALSSAPSASGAEDAPLFNSPAPGSVWEKLIFQPLYDPVDVIQSAFMVKTKRATIVPFRLFRTQRLMMQNAGLKNVVVKPRQVGSSTIWLAAETANAVTTPNVNTLIVTHRDDTTASMRTTVQDFIRYLNEYMNFGLEIGKDNENQLEIKSTGSWFFFATAGGGGAGRSRTIHQLHASELAHWNVPDPGAELGGMTESVPDNGLIVIESTPNGATGPFYNTYNSDGSYTKHFYPWFYEPSRRIPLNGVELHLTEEEMTLVMTHKLSHEQIAWRRKKMKDMQAVGLSFAQEYPEDDITCFTAGVRSFFPSARMIPYLRLSQAQGLFYAEPVKGDTWDPGGELRTFEPPRAGWHYAIHGDIGGGHRDGDESVAYVRCYETGKICAVLSGWWQPNTFVDLTIDLLAFKYNEAVLSFETNGIGAGAIGHAAYTRKYPNLYWERRSVQTRDGVLEEWRPGLYIISNQRTELLNRVKEQVVDGTLNCLDERLIRQMTAARLVRKQSGGTFRDAVEIPESIHDDYLMAYAGLLEVMANHKPSSGSGRPRTYQSA